MFIRINPEARTGLLQSRVSFGLLRPYLTIMIHNVILNVCEGSDAIEIPPDAIASVQNDSLK